MSFKTTAPIAASLGRWRKQLQLTAREQALLGPELRGLDQQLLRFKQGTLRLAVFGRVGVGKSSLLNALLREEKFRTDVAHGCTRKQETAPWSHQIPGLAPVLLIDTPGIDEIAASARQRLATKIATGADLILLVLNTDLSSPELEALEVLRRSGKPLFLVANGADRWNSKQRAELSDSIQRRAAGEFELVWVAAAPRKAELLPDGRVRSRTAEAEVEALRIQLLELLQHQGQLLLTVNSLQRAETFSRHLLEERLRQRQRTAQGLIGRFATYKAAALAINPLAMLDLAGSAAADGALVLKLCELYGLRLQSPQTKKVLQHIGQNSALVGGVQWGLQGLLGLLKQFLLLAAPASAGLSLAPAAPVAIAQVALAVHGTRRTGRETTRQLLLAAYRGPSRPAALLHRLRQQEPLANRWLGSYPPWSPNALP
jgi:small GTP-binding protein